MNTNKIIFSIIGAVLLIFTIFIALNLNSDTTPVTNNASNTLSIWILHDDPDDFSTISEAFKETFPEYRNKTISVESFDDINSYNRALSAAFLAGTGPDIFSIHSSEVSPFENQIRGISPAIISPNDFRLEYETVFGDELIISEESDSSIEFVKAVPLGFESLGVFYNRRYYTRPSSLLSWSSLSSEIEAISERYGSNVIPIALGNGEYVGRSPEILQALFALEGSTSLTETDNNTIRDVVTMYRALGDGTSENTYNALARNAEASDIELFSEGRVGAIVGYPRDLLSIDNAGYQKSFLFASPLPNYSSGNDTTFIEYQSLALNKESINPDMSESFLQFLVSRGGQESIVSSYPYYLSANSEVLSSQQESKILPAYNIVYKNFIGENTRLISFDVLDIGYYSRASKEILDRNFDASEKFGELRSYLVCSSNKHQTLLSLSSSCTQ